MLAEDQGADARARAEIEHVPGRALRKKPEEAQRAREDRREHGIGGWDKWRAVRILVPIGGDEHSSDGVEQDGRVVLLAVGRGGLRSQQVEGEERIERRPIDRLRDYVVGQGLNEQKEAYVEREARRGRSVEIELRAPYAPHVGHALDAEHAADRVFIEARVSQGMLHAPKRAPGV